MWQEVYYKHYRENCKKGNYREMEERSLPFSIKCKSGRTKEALVKLLKKDGIECVGGTQCLGLLVNLELMRFCSYPAPVTMPCLHQQSYSEESFLLEVYFPWFYDSFDVTQVNQAVAHQIESYRSFLKDCFEPEPGMTQEELMKNLIVPI